MKKLKPVSMFRKNPHNIYASHHMSPNLGARLHHDNRSGHNHIVRQEIQSQFSALSATQIDISAISPESPLE